MVPRLLRNLPRSRHGNVHAGAHHRRLRRTQCVRVPHADVLQRRAVCERAGAVQHHVQGECERHVELFGEISRDCRPICRRAIHWESELGDSVVGGRGNLGIGAHDGVFARGDAEQTDVLSSASTG